MHASPQPKTKTQETTQAPIQRKTAEAVNQPWQPLSPNLSFDLPESATENTGTPIQRMEGTAPQPAPAEPNRTGLPDQMKTNLETMSGFDMSDVRVHYNSPKPAAIGALAYTQGNQIHMGPGQNKHLGHEAWHVAQQKQGRVKATTQFKGMQGNDDAGLEREADEQGARISTTPNDNIHIEVSSSPNVQTSTNTIQRVKAKKSSKHTNKQKRIKKFLSRYYTLKDPYTLHNTKKEAEDYDKALGGVDVHDEREPTLYSYTHQKTTKQISDKPQGPHTIANKVLKTILIGLEEDKIREKNTTFNLLNIKTPEEINNLVLPRTDKQLESRLQRYRTDYKKLYDTEYDILLTPGKKRLLYKLMQLHPKQTYAWKTIKNASKKSVGGKGEGTKTKFDDLIDTGGKLKDDDEFKKLKDIYRPLYNDYK